MLTEAEKELLLRPSRGEIDPSLPVLGVVSEYNPFHNGHLYQINEARRRLGPCPVIALMSGSFVQRGAPALFNKWDRAKAAVQSGVDLVLELPAAFSLRSADYFASGSMRTLDATGIVDKIICGSEIVATEDEHGNKLPDLSASAACLLRPETKARAYELLQEGISYGTAWQQAVTELLPGGERFLSGPNNILSISYQKAILKYDLDLKLCPLPRKGSGHNDSNLQSPFASATSIRKVYMKNHSMEGLETVMPEKSYKIMEDLMKLRLEKGDISYDPAKSICNILAYLLSLENGNTIYLRCNADQGLCDRLVKHKHELSKGWENFITAVITKRYSRPSVRRMMLQLLLNENREFWQSKTSPGYLRVLAFNDTGRYLLRKMKDTAELPIITKLGRLNQYEGCRFYNTLRVDIRATDLYYLLRNNAGIYDKDFTTSPYYHKNS